LCGLHQVYEIFLLLSYCLLSLLYEHFVVLLMLPAFKNLACKVGGGAISVIFGSQDQDVVKTHFGLVSLRELKYISQNCCGKPIDV